MSNTTSNGPKVEIIEQTGTDGVKLRPTVRLTPTENPRPQRPVKPRK